jgi:predicted nucleic acid-binding protein
MKYLLDTCVISEIIKPRPSPNVMAWMQEGNENEFYISVLSFGELKKGIEKVVDVEKKRKLQLWVVHDLKQRFNNRIISINLEISVCWGAIQGNAEKKGKSMPVIDGLIAATGLVSHCIVVTRNITDMEASGAELLNPWDSL